MIQWLLVIQVLLLWLNDITVSSCRSTSTFSLDSKWCLLRGGESEEENVGQGSTTNSNDEKSTADSTFPEISRKKVSSGPFRLLQEVRDEIFAHIEDDVHPNDNSEQDDKEEELEVEELSLTRTTKSLVGGAVVAKERNLEGAPMGVDTNRVAPLSLRLLEESPDENDEEDEAATPESFVDTKSHVAKLWWVNVWTQQLSELDTMEIQNDDDSEEESTSSSETVEEEESTKELTLVPTDQQQIMSDAEVAIDAEKRKLEEKETVSIESNSFVSSGLVSISISCISLR